MGSARPLHFDVGGPLCDTWTPKPCNAAQSGRKRAQIVLKSTKNGPKVVPKVASRVQKNTKYIEKYKKVRAFCNVVQCLSSWNLFANWPAFRLVFH